ncbi:MAG: DNA polymerase/3'-5' exonuclease PolX [Phaeodactylibacter sp.]|nr:DNA polymerase/3'-5' exonuclease PolX [Phaeodactylibacter sp.]MCB9292166.1 DNA polymerase/3'-5' exonuclease PolX [Lewinellaceae bacterium]MCB9298979.1 DNA polymerase/3'-5' exonuclease PolX [Lewinellaceae bacterium]
MTNKDIARHFQLLGRLMELHGENPFKIRSYQNAYRTLRSLDKPLEEMDEEEIASIKGVGKAISGKIRELVENGQMQTLEKYREKTPEGIQEMLGIKGFGPKKIMAVWQGLGVESVGELLYAANENRLVELKGFGRKTQEELKKQLEYYQRSKHQYHYATLEKEAEQLEEAVGQTLPGARANLCGAIRRRANVVERIELLIGYEGGLDALFKDGLLKEEEQAEGFILAKTAADTPVRLYQCPPAEFGARLFELSSQDDFLEAFAAVNGGPPESDTAEEAQVFEKAGLPFIAPELREQGWAVSLAREGNLPELVTESDIKGVVHAHSTYSDGGASLRDMALYAKELGYEYLGMTDHSKSAFYANGLQPERVFRQMEEIDALNEELAPFRIFKGIESDILSDGSLDYGEEVLQAFDFIIASVHSNLRMDEDKATQRLIAAIENPYTAILGHPTGRLLLSREGYPIGYKKVIDACAANGVAIELNANPYRLDLDWSWIPYALEKGVLISVNPDAHSKEGIHDIHFGVLSARKGGLTAEMCLNAKGVEEFGKWVRR